MSWWAEFRTPFRMSKCIFVMQLPNINFEKYYEKSFNRWNRHYEQNTEHFSQCRCSLFLCISHILIFYKYLEKSFSIGSVMMSRIQNTFHNVEVYYFYAAAIYYFSKILWKILYRWKHHDEQNSEHFSERRSLFFLCSCYILIF